ncbi:MAG: excinuclease ABC subunit C, partial [Desulfobacterales bacterium]|nr:excinuclease ABC subunit C [Desulfobacterales bacterium]
RKGYLVGSRSYYFRDFAGPASEVMEAFLKQYYSREAFIPKQVLISEAIEDLLPIKEWLCDLAGKKVVLHRPLRGEKLRLAKMALANAENRLAGRPESQREDLMHMVRSCLQLKRPPRFIEGLDISNLQGDMAVGTIVSFVDGLPHRSGYRNYKIRLVNGIDDYGMMSELMERRVSKGRLPDLFLVDGGKGHLSLVKRVLDRQTGPDVSEVASIAKPDESRQEKYDKIYIPGRKNPLGLKENHPVLLLMMRIRDEAHRRAVSYHRGLRRGKLRKSILDSIAGVGIKRKKALFRHFKTIGAIAEAGVKDLTEVSGINHSLAGNIHAFFQAGKPEE